MFLVEACADKFDNGDVMPGLASGAETVAEHESQGSFQHRLVGLLEASFLVKSQDFVRRSKLLIGAGEEATDLRPVDVVGLELFHADL